MQIENQGTTICYSEQSQQQVNLMILDLTPPSYLDSRELLDTNSQKNRS